MQRRLKLTSLTEVSLVSRASGTGRGTKRKQDELGTRERLLLTAERLIAEEGVGQVSMRQINAEAGARNLSAVHYHFGSLEGVIAAIFAHRMGAVERRRSAMLDELVAGGAERAGLQEILHAVVWPLAEQMLSQAGDNHYVRFLAAINRTSRFDSWSVVRPRHRRGLVRSYVMLRRLLPDLPKEVLHMRMIIELRTLMYTLADVDVMIRDRHPALRDSLVIFHASDLVTRIAAALMAPLSEATRMARRVLQASGASERAPLFGVDAIWAVGRPALAAA